METVETSTTELEIPPHESALMRYQDGTASRYHRRAAMIVRPQKEIQKAAENRPFADLTENAGEIKAALAANPSSVQDAIARQAEEFLRNMWPMLEEDQLGFPVSFSLDEEDDPQEVECLSEIIEANQRLGLDQQAETELPKLLRHFSSVRGTLRFMRQSGLLLPHTILPDSQLPHFLVTAPVWYVGGHHQFAYDTASPDPRPDKFVRFMAKRLGTQRLADWFQIWNRRSRPFSDYAGDAIPHYLLDLIGHATEVFDYVVIATPFHDVASKEWADPNWQRLIDPYLLAFHEDLPSMFFFLGRWSNTGVFPLAAEMTASTIAYLHKHIDQIPAAFKNPYWSNVDDNGASCRSGNELYASVAPALEAFDEGNLFSWLSEGRPQSGI
jgi:hypothetical protein